MAKYSAIKAAVNAYIKANGKKEITGSILNSVLNATIDSLGRYFQFAGGAMPTDDPGTPDQNACYLAGEPGVYTDFGGITIENEEVALLFWDGEWTKQRILIGIQEVEASVDNQVGTPSVDVSYSGGQLVLTFHNLKGEQGIQGETGAAAGFGTIGADINDGVGTPGVSVDTSGSDTAKNLMFHFTNLKGETGVTSVVATIDNTSGTPSCQVSLVNGVLTLAFSGLKGLKGDTGVSADYPITIYNGLDSDATDQALAAAQGKVLDGKVSQLQQELYGINVGTWELGTIGVADVGTMEVPSVFTNYAIRTKNITALFTGDVTFTPGSGWEIRVLVANGKRTDNTFYSTPVTVAINEGDVFRLALRTNPQSDLSSNTSAQIQTLVANSGFSSVADSIVEIKSVETRVTKVERDTEKLNNILSSFSVGGWEAGAIGSAPVGTMTVPDVFTNFAARTKNITAEKSGSYSFKIGSGWLVKLIVANGVRDDSNYYQEITQEIASGQVYRLAVKTDPNQTDFSTYTSAQLSALIDSAGFLSLINGDNIALDIAKDAKEKADAVSENYTTANLQTYLDNAETGYITYSGGTLQPHDGYRHTAPIPLKKGEKIVFVGDSVSLCAVFASCESDGSNCFPLMQGISPIGESAIYQYYATNDTYIIISYVYHSDVTFNTAKIVRDSFVYEASRGASLTTEAESGLISISDNPLSLVKETPGYSGAIRSWGFVGDSLASGVFFGYKDGVEWSDTNYDISWGQFMVRAMSAEGKNYSVGGQTAKWWVNNFLPPADRSLAGVQADGGKQAYIIALGVNDAGNLSSLYGGKVATDMENISADIDFNTPANNANTFAGWYARVIQEIKAISPDSLIFPVVMPEQANETWANINTVIRSMQTIFATQYPNTIWTIDLYTYKPSQQYLSAFKMNGAHLNAQGYLYTAWEFMTYIDWLIRKNMSAFKGLCFIGTGAHINND